MKHFILLLTMVMAAQVMTAQNVASHVNKKALKNYPKGFDNHLFGVLYYNGKNVYNLRDYRLCTGDSIDDIKMNPSYTSFATLEHNKKGKKHVTIWGMKRDMILQTIKFKDVNTTAIAYSYDAKQFAVATADKKINIFNPQTQKIVKTFGSAIVPTKMEYSDNGYFLAASNGKTIEIWNLERGTVRKTIETDATANDFVFANNSAMFEVLKSNGTLDIYDTKTFNVSRTIDDLGQGVACYPNESGKYVAVLNSDKRISVINILDPTERHIIENPIGGITGIRIVHHDLSDYSYIIYNTNNSITYQHLKGLTPYYNKMMTTMLNEKLNQWMKQFDGRLPAACQRGIAYGTSQTDRTRDCHPNGNRIAGRG